MEWAGAFFAPDLTTNLLCKLESAGKGDCEIYASVNVVWIHEKNFSVLRYSSKKKRGDKGMECIYCDGHVIAVDSWGNYKVVECAACGVRYDVRVEKED